MAALTLYGYVCNSAPVTDTGKAESLLLFPTLQPAHVDMVATVREPLRPFLETRQGLASHDSSLHQLSATPEGYGEIKVREAMCWAHPGSQATAVLMATIMLSV